MRQVVKEYFLTLKSLFSKISAVGANGEVYQFDEAMDMSIRMIIDQAASGKKLFLIGNGASASISSHIAADFWKNAGIRALTFNDSTLLTCISNDYGYKHVFEKPIDMFADRGDILIAISSSGQSDNILSGVLAAKKKNVKVITLSGFKKNNSLSSLGDINFYVPASEYGYVEAVHLSICHCFVDMVIGIKNGQILNRQP
ncbi:MAG: SIS domain-containing protein [Candidatus Aureabacteria bacterium]|nr:SIS domain-containing protein [Candidatus Auribacterota bacterium]